VLLDLRLPGMDGIALCKLMRETQITREIPVILLTGAESAEYAETGFEAGATDFMTKPFSPSLLRARVSGWLQRRASEPHPEL